MTKNAELMKQAMTKFYDFQVMTLHDLMSIVKRSKRSVQRYLQLWRCLSSYNHNGKYYTLPDIPDFDQFGIWKYRDIGFSRYGNLSQTVRQLVENSKAGMTASELGEVMGVNAHSFISHFRDDPCLQRDKLSGRWVYFSAKPEIVAAQRDERYAVEPQIAMPSDAQAVIILVCLLKNPDAKIGELVREVQNISSGIERAMIERLLAHHGLKKNSSVIASNALEHYLGNLLGDGKSIFRSTQHAPDAFADVLKFASSQLRGNPRRSFMAQCVDACGPGGQRWAEQRLQWNRGTIRKGQKEIRDGVPIVDQFSKRGRKKAEEKLVHLMDDIKSLAEPESQVDPTFRTTNIYTRLTARTVRERLISQKNYASDELPTERTIGTKLDDLDYQRRKVIKSKPKKKIPQTDAIFEQVHEVNRLADRTEGVLRASLDAKAAIKVGSFSRGGYNRRKVSAADHDFKPDMVLNLFGFLLPDYAQNYLCFSKSKITADFIVDSLQFLWPMFKETFNPHTLVL